MIGEGESHVLKVGKRRGGRGVTCVIGEEERGESRVESGEEERGRGSRV